VDAEEKYDEVKRLAGTLGERRHTNVLTQNMARNDGRGYV